MSRAYLSLPTQDVATLSNTALLNKLTLANSGFALKPEQSAA